jgi:membrane protein
MTKFKGIIQKSIDFITTDVWRIRTRNLPQSKLILIKYLRVILLALRGFREDKCQLRASALTFYTLLSVVPVFAMAFGVAKGFGFEEKLREQLLDKIPGQEQVIIKIIDFSYNFLDNTKGGMIAGIGIVVLFWSVIKVLSNIERSLNDIWGIKQHRTYVRKFSDYLSMMMICPLFIIMSGSFTLLITSQIKFVMGKIALLGVFSPIIFFLLRFTPYIIIWILFTFIYIFMPNTKVNFKSGIIAGVIAGTLYQITQLLYIDFQIVVARYNAIYGSFAALPLFLIWLQLSWIVVLLGAEISFAHQNVDTYEFEPDCLKVSYSFKKLLTLKIVHQLIILFDKGEKPWTAVRISQELEIPIRLVRQIMYDLSMAGIISEINNKEDRSISYQPACSIDKFTISYVINSLEKYGKDEIPVAESEVLSKLSKSLETFQRELENSEGNLLLKNL